MSGSIFLIEFAFGAGLACAVSMKQMLSALGEVAREMEVARRASLAALEWARSEGNINIPMIDVDLPIFEAKLPPEFTKDSGISNEIIRAVPINDREVQIIITDASLQPKKCEEIAVDFAQRLYEKATGERIDRSMILVKGIATLSGKICEHCLREIDGPPYVCKVCGRTFCYDHRRPETHGCGVKPRVVEEEPRISPVTHPSSAAEESGNTPRVVVRRLPCG
jgi:hypothetical protein